MKTMRFKVRGKDNRTFELEYIVSKGKVLSFIVVEAGGFISDVKIFGR